MNADQKSRNRKKLLWPLTAVTIGALLSMNHFYAPQLSLKFVVAAWLADLVVVLISLAHPVTTRLGVLATGVFFAVPCFLRAPPLFRGLLMCCMALPLAIASASLFAPPTAGYRTRLAYFFNWMDTQKIQRRPRSFAVAPLFRLLTAVVILAAALACVKAVSAVGFWLLLRWLAAGIMIFSFAEIVTANHDFLTALMGLDAPALMRSPFLSRSVGEFWTRRWNVAASALCFRPLAFAPLARHGIVLALFAAFFASALAHVLLAFMAMGRWNISLVCGSFFLLQPLLILAERRMNVRRWPVAAARVWTLAALAITSPLFVEPALQLLAPSWGATNDILTPTIFTVSFAIGMNLFFSLGQLASCPRFKPSNVLQPPTTAFSTRHEI